MITECDFLVVGSGIAGLTYALRVSEYGSVILITKKNDTESNTNYAQGGIAAVLGSDDNYDLHVEDTMVAGAGLCHRDVVEMLVHEGPERVKNLMSLGATFTQELVDNQATLSLGREGGHSRRRIVHAADLTGREVERALVYQVKNNSNITFNEDTMVIDLIVKPSGNRSVCRGAHVLETHTGKTYTISARTTMLCTGGLGRAYLRTTNPDIATGDGVAYAYWHGARVGNMEFTQFHPTSLYHEKGNAFLISEAVRGEGGLLRLRDGRTFMEDYHSMGCLAPRDIVARAIVSELKASGEECVWLDITHLGEAKLKERFPNIYERCYSLGIDISREWIPIVPAAHYACGGVTTDTWGRTDIGNLYATGEVAFTGVHGANRLASNSLLEALVFSHRAADDAINTLAESSNEAIDQFNDSRHCRPVPLEIIKELTLRVRTILWVYAGIVRTNQWLLEAKEEIDKILIDADELWKDGNLTRDLLELRTMSTVADLIIRSAIIRKESRGLHYNLDYPNTDDQNWKKDTYLTISPN